MFLFKVSVGVLGAHPQKGLGWGTVSQARQIPSEGTEEPPAQLREQCPGLDREEEEMGRRRGSWGSGVIATCIAQIFLTVTLIEVFFPSLF